MPGIKIQNVLRIFSWSPSVLSIILHSLHRIYYYALKMSILDFKRYTLVAHKRCTLAYIIVTIYISFVASCEPGTEDKTGNGKYIICSNCSVLSLIINTI